MQPRKISGHGAVFCLIRELSGPGSRKRVVGKGVVLLSVRVYFYGPGLNFDSSEMIYIDNNQQIKEMMTNQQKNANMKRS